MFGSFSIGSRDFGSAPFTLTPPTSNSSGAFTFTSSNTDVATVDGNTVTIVGAGTAVITATQAAITNYTVGTISAPFVVNPIAPTLGSFTIPAKNFGSVPFILNPPTSNSDGAFTFTSSNTAVATFNIPNLNALNFDGVNDTVALSRYPTLSSTNKLTIEGWIYITSYTKNVITLNSHSGIDILADGKISISTNFTGNGWVNVTSDSPVPLNSWTYIAVVINDGGYNKMYINNTLVKNSVNTGSGLFIACTAISLAANAPASVNFSNISMSEFRIWSVARTAQQIADNYNTQIPSNSSGLVIYYKFDQGTANGTNTEVMTLIDSTSNNYHGTLQGFALSGTTSNWVSGPILPLVCTIVGAGTTIITATQAATTNYTSKSIGADFVVNPIAPTLSAFTTASRYFGSQPFDILPNTHTVLYIRNENSDWQTRIINNDTSDANLKNWSPLNSFGFDNIEWSHTNSESQVALQFRFFAVYVLTFYNITAASCMVVSSKGNLGIYSFVYNGGTNYTLTFIGRSMTINYTLPVDVRRNMLQPTSNSSGTFSYESSNTDVATVVGNTLTIVNAGSTTITATQVAAGIYSSGTIFAPFVVNPIAPTLGIFSIDSRDFNSGAFTLTPPSSDSLGAFTFTSSKPEVATVGSTTGEVTIVGAGTTIITATQAATTNYTSKSTGADFVVNPIAPTFGSFLIAPREFGSAPFTLTPPSSNSLGAFTFTSSNTGVATVDGNTVTIVGAGTTVITATQAATTNYAVGTISAPFVVNPTAPTLSNFPDIVKNFGSVPFILNPPTSNSDGAFIYTSSDESVATILGNTVTILKIGFTIITATQAATINFISKKILTRLDVNPGPPTFGVFTITSKDFGSLPFILNPPTSNSDGAFTFTSSNTAVATISGSTVTIVDVGSSIITATQAATNNYKSGTVTAPFVVNGIATTLSAFTIVSRNFGDQPFSIISPENTHTVLYLRNGGSDWETRIINNDTSNTNLQAWIPDSQWWQFSLYTEIRYQFMYFAAYVTAYYNIKTASCMVVALNGNVGTYSFTKNTDYGEGYANYTGIFNGEVRYWNYYFPLVVQRNSLISNSPGVFTFESSNPNVATISGSTVTIVSAGSSTITARQAAITGYSSGQITTSLVIRAASPTISNFTVPPKTISDVSFTLSAPTSNSSGSFSYTSSNHSVATILGSAVTIVGVGTTTITATQAATTNYTSGVITASLVVGLPAPTISNFTVPSKNFGDAPFTLSAPTSNSSGSFSYTSSNESVATISESTVTIVSFGSSTITARQSATTNYISGEITALLVVSPPTPTISNFTVPSKNFGDGSFTLTAPTSNSPGVFYYTSSNESVATISGNTVTTGGAGYSTITATQAATDNFTSGQIVTTFVVNPIAPTLSNFNIPGRYWWAPPYWLEYSVWNIISDNGKNFSFTSSDPSIAYISGSLETGGFYLNNVARSGVVTITATLPATQNYTSGQISTYYTVDADLHN
jgi:uncharacterized protein YjdB